MHREEGRLNLSLVPPHDMMDAKELIFTNLAKSVDEKAAWMPKYPILDVRENNVKPCPGDIDVKHELCAGLQWSQRAGTGAT